MGMYRVTSLSFDTLDQAEAYARHLRNLGIAYEIVGRFGRLGSWSPEKGFST